MPTSINSSGITFPNGTTQTTAFTGTGGVTSLNGQTGAITNTNIGVIGSYFPGGVQSLTVYALNSTVAGSSLRYNGGISAFDTVDIFTGGGVLNPSYTGTWRAMARSAGANECGEFRFIGLNLWVRIS